MMIHFICLRPPVGWCVYVFSLLTAKELIVCIFTPICPQQIAHQQSCKIQWQIKLKIEECSESFVDEYWLKICWDWSPREVTNTSYHIGNSYARNMCSVCDWGFIAWREFLVSGWQWKKYRKRSIVQTDKVQYQKVTTLVALWWPRKRKKIMAMKLNSNIP